MAYFRTAVMKARRLVDLGCLLLALSNSFHSPGPIHLYGMMVVLPQASPPACQKRQDLLLYELCGAGTAITARVQMFEILEDHFVLRRHVLLETGTKRAYSSVAKENSEDPFADVHRYT